MVRRMLAATISRSPAKIAAVTASSIAFAAFSQASRRVVAGRVVSGMKATMSPVAGHGGFRAWMVSRFS